MIRAMRFVAILFLLGSTVARAQEPPATPAPATPAPPTPAKPPAASSAPSSPSSNDMNFDLLGDDKQKKSPIDQAREQERIAKLERKVHLRRQLLKWHVALGFVTLAALAVTDVIGTLSYYDKYTANGTDTGRFATYHEALGIGTASLFGITGILALAAPNPYPKPLKLDAALVHKLSMLMATACFAAQLIMGPLMAVSDGKLFQKDMAIAHLVIGYGAFAFMGAGTLAFVF
jgi:cytochrome b561